MDIVSMVRAKPANGENVGENKAKSADSNAEVRKTEENKDSTKTADSEDVSDIVESPTRTTPIWKIHGSHMVTRLPPINSLKNFYKDRWDPESTSIRVAAFDMDDTLICTSSGIKFGRGPHDWKWRNKEVLPVLEKKVIQENRVLVIFTNQSSVSVTEQRALVSKSYKNLTVKLGLMAASLDAQYGYYPMLFFASTGKPRKGVYPRSSDETHFSHRKPESGMWSELERYLKRCFGPQYEIDKEQSYFVGDAAGRDGDHSAADSGFAENAGVPFFVPEDYFGL
ncbi:hypothetical protein OXX59_009206 [Metschnikowia pulcherrima]